MPKCGNCDGGGEVDCGECIGGRVACAACGQGRDCEECVGAGVVECDNCDGTGQEAKPL